LTWLYVAFGSLLVLLAVTIGVCFAPLGALHTWFGLGIAVTKTFIVVVVFMGLPRSSGSAKLAAGAGLLWLCILFSFVMADYVTRGWGETQEHDLNDSNHFTTYDHVEFKSEADP